MLSNMKILLGILLVVAGAAFWVLKEEQSTPQSSALLPSWQTSDEHITAMQRVTLEQGGQTISLRRADQRWVLNDGFFANIEPLFQLLQSFKNAEIVEAKTANPDNHSQVSLADEDLKVSFYDDSGLLQAIHVGKQATSGLTFVRFADQDQTYTVSGLERITFNQDSWQLKTVLDVPAEQIQTVQISSESGEVVEAKRDDVSSDWQLMGIPEGFELRPNAALNALASGLTRLMIDDALPLDLSDKTEVLSATYGLFEGGPITLLVHQQAEDQYWLQIDSPEHPEYGPWMLKIAPYKFNALNKQLADYVQEKPAPTTQQDQGSEDDSVDPVVE